MAENLWRHDNHKKEGSADTHETTDVQLVGLRKLGGLKDEWSKVRNFLSRWLVRDEPMNGFFQVAQPDLCKGDVVEVKVKGFSNHFQVCSMILSDQERSYREIYHHGNAGVVQLCQVSKAFLVVDRAMEEIGGSVSYTHLTLPTILLV